jgi:single-strand DNA-binding protein
MSGVNKAILIGHLGKDPEIRNTQAGKPVATFSMATSRTWRDKDSGERKEATQWHRVVVFNENLCKIVEQYLHKGSKVYVEGEICTRKWTDQGGVERYVTEIVLSGFGGQITMLDNREGVPAAESPDDFGTQKSATQSGAAPPAGGKPPIDDEIPF